MNHSTTDRGCPPRREAARSGRLSRRLTAAVVGALAALPVMAVGVGPAAAASPCPAGQVQLEAHAGGDRSCVAPEAVGSRMTSFDVSRNGFQFKNDFSTQPVLDVRFGGLCGGMVYSALDHFWTGRPTPTQDTMPATGSALFNYIYERQEPSIVDNLDKWIELTVNPFGINNSKFFNWGLQGYDGGRLQELREEIDAGRPAPLGLFKQDVDVWGPHHQVLAVGYDLGRYAGDLGPFQEELKIFVYDPNFPNELLTLSPLPGSNLFGYVGHPEQTWRTYFVDRKYGVTEPPAFVDPPVATEGVVSELILKIGTGGDDLRGGNDNSNVTVNFRTGPPQQVNNVNGSARWIDNYQQIVRIPLDRPVPADEIADVVLTTTFGGGFGGDNWNVDSLQVLAGDRTLFQASGRPLVRFTGDNLPFVATIN